MADDKKAKPAAGDDAAAAKGGGAMKLVVIGVVVMLVAALAAGGVYKFVLAPRLQPEDPEQAKAVEEQKKAEEEEHHTGEPMPGAAVVEFEDESVNIMPDKEGGKAALLNYKCAMVVPTETLAEELKSKKAFFSSKILMLHSNRTKTELNDPRVKESILRQAKQECNALMKRLFPEDKEAEVLEVIHVKYTIFEL